MKEASAVTQVVYIIRETTSKAHIVGLLQKPHGIAAGLGGSVRVVPSSRNASA